MATPLRTNELKEFVMQGMFSGIQSEVLSGEVYKLNGFVDTNNVMFRRGALMVAPTDININNATQQQFRGMFSFYRSDALLRQLVYSLDNNHVYSRAPYAGGLTFVDLGALSASAGDIDWACVGQKVLFSQGTDVVQLWDGYTAGFAAASASAVPARFLAEIANHLVVGYTVEAGPTQAPQRVRWTGSGDPTDWTSLNAGQNDLFNDLGEITGIKKMYQQGFIWQKRGIVQVIPTGVGTAPFNFVPISSQAKGNAVPMSLACNNAIACYLGESDVYMFDGARSYSIGSALVNGTWYGARSRIMYDAALAGVTFTPGYVRGIITESILNVPFRAYWLLFPNNIWVYNLDEGNWVTIYLGSGQTQLYDIGIFYAGLLPGSVKENLQNPVNLSTSVTGNTNELLPNVAISSLGPVHL